ncbi:tetratricopeptide repeat protein [Vibrio cincinnatiensis]|uniref:tetratricopeptide repeat protein n=1 Tax=Vibrio cincinnatiensis TaxID=675 RepID=UPI001EDFF375|nr:hypothetical protein [Vibrio cincinnatiensis]MCG3733109.1 hypothetical protein [Vibrio cincinnatiensis]MCG3739899.1 hypothetical protein [Vibrio cincinnatiensis]
MRRFYLVFTFTLLLLGCTSAKNYDVQSLTAQNLLIKTGNASELIQSYKSYLFENSSDYEVIYKLINIYIDSGDFESASFYMNFLLKEENAFKNPDWLFTASKINLNLGDVSFAKSYALQAYRLNNRDKDILNILGIIGAMEGQYSVARQRFESARMAMADDTKIKNNLAIIDILEKQYHKAYQRLSPLLKNKVVDNQIKVTMSIVLAKLNQFTMFEDLMKDIEHQYIHDLYIDLAEADFRYAKDVFNLTYTRDY